MSLISKGLEPLSRLLAAHHTPKTLNEGCEPGFLIPQHYRNPERLVALELPGAAYTGPMAKSFEAPGKTQHDSSSVMPISDSTWPRYADWKAKKL